jgi:hypothetical protein
MDKVLGGPQELILTLKSREKSFDAALAWGEPEENTKISDDNQMMFADGHMANNTTIFKIFCVTNIRN